jgi:hypothetical protein
LILKLIACGSFLVLENVSGTSIDAKRIEGTNSPDCYFSNVSFKASNSPSLVCKTGVKLNAVRELLNSYSRWKVFYFRILSTPSIKVGMSDLIISSNGRFVSNGANRRSRLNVIDSFIDMNFA